MKIRNGFVSNSSSSSFLLCVKKDDFDKQIKTMKDEEQKFLKANFSPDTIFGIAVMKYCWWTSPSNSKFEYDDEVPEDYYEILESFERKFKEKFTHNEDW